MPTTSILITGCSSGIGYCAATMLKQRGYLVFAAARRAQDVEKLRAEGFESVQLEVNDTVSMERALEVILAKTGGTLDALFNNAGFLKAGAVEDLSRDDIRAQFETNVFGPMELIRLVLPIMRKQGHGRIIQNSSILGVITLPYYGAYNASKHALEGFSLSLSQELIGTSIHVSLINPGPITSKLRDHAFQQYQQSLAHQTTTAYRDVYKKLEDSYFHPGEKDLKIMQHPEAVVKKLIHALESRHPKTHYFIGLPANVLAILRRILPDSVLNWLLTKTR